LGIGGESADHLWFECAQEGSFPNAEGLDNSVAFSFDGLRKDDPFGASRTTSIRHASNQFINRDVVITALWSSYAHTEPASNLTPELGVKALPGALTRDDSDFRGDVVSRR